MKILYVDAISTPTAQSNIQGVIGGYKALGHNVLTFDYRKRARELGKDKTWALGKDHWSRRTHDALASTNDQLVHLCKKCKPDFVHLGKCEYVSGDAIKRIKALTDAFIVHLYLDMSEEVKPWVTDIGRYADWTMLAHQDQNIVDKHLETGCRNVGFWIPGVDTNIYKPCSAKTNDILFTGNCIGRTGIERTRLLNTLTEAGLQVTVYGRNWKLAPSIKVHDFVEGTKLAAAISSARIALGYNTSEFRMYASWRRILNTMACGTMLLCRYFLDSETVFADGLELVCFDSISEAVEKAKYYLIHPEEREEIARCAIEKVRRDFTWPERLQVLVELMK